MPTFGFPHLGRPGRRRRDHTDSQAGRSAGDAAEALPVTDRGPVSPVADTTADPGPAVHDAVPAGGTGGKTNPDHVTEDITATDLRPERVRAARLLQDAGRTVTRRAGTVARRGVRPLFDEIATQVRPADPEALRRAHPDWDDDRVAADLIRRASRTAAAVALLAGTVLVAQGVVTVAATAVPPAAGVSLATLTVTVTAEVLALFAVEAKLRADLDALAGRPRTDPRQLVAAVIGTVQAAGGVGALRGRTLRAGLPDRMARQATTTLVRYVPARFARVLAPAIIVPAVGSAIAARIAYGQVRAAGERHWKQLRTGELSATPETSANH